MSPRMYNLPCSILYYHVEISYYIGGPLKTIKCQINTRTVYTLVRIMRYAYPIPKTWSCRNAHVPRCSARGVQIILLFAVHSNGDRRRRRCCIHTYRYEHIKLIWRIYLNIYMQYYVPVCIYRYICTHMLSRRTKERFTNVRPHLPPSGGTQPTTVNPVPSRRRFLLYISLNMYIKLPPRTRDDAIPYLYIYI